MTPASTPHGLAAFEGRPSLHAAPAAVASLLGHGVPPALAERMLAAPTLRERLDAELRSRLGALPPKLTPVQAYVAALDPAGLLRLTLRAGAAWHAAEIAKAYDGATVRALVERIGPEFRGAALADLAAHPRPAAPVGAAAPSSPTPSSQGLDALPAAIARDGTACMVAWCEAQPRAVGWRVLLRLRVNGRPGPEHGQLGPAIVERLAAPGAPP